MAPGVAEVRAVQGPVQALAHAVTAVASDFVSELGPSTSASMPPALAPRPANIIITGEGDTSVEAEAAAAPSIGDPPPEVCLHLHQSGRSYMPCNNVPDKPGQRSQQAEIM